MKLIITSTHFKEARNLLGLTQGQLGRNLGVSEKTIGELERSSKDIPEGYALSVTHMLSYRRMSGKFVENIKKVDPGYELPPNTYIWNGIVVDYPPLIG